MLTSFHFNCDCWGVSTANYVFLFPIFFILDVFSFRSFQSIHNHREDLHWLDVRLHEIDGGINARWECTRRFFLFCFSLFSSNSNDSRVDWGYLERTFKDSSLTRHNFLISQYFFERETLSGRLTCFLPAYRKIIEKDSPVQVQLLFC